MVVTNFLWLWSWQQYCSNDVLKVKPIILALFLFPLIVVLLIGFVYFILCTTTLLLDDNSCSPFIIFFIFVLSLFTKSNSYLGQFMGIIKHSSNGMDFLSLIELSRSSTMSSQFFKYKNPKFSFLQATRFKYVAYLNAKLICDSSNEITTILLSLILKKNKRLS